MNYADPGYNTPAFRNDNFNFDRYRVNNPFSNGFLPEAWYYRSFDAWVNDGLKNIFSNSWHFLGKATNLKYSWLLVDQLSSRSIHEKQEITKDDKFIYTKITYSPSTFEQSYDYTGQGKKLRVSIPARNTSTIVDISKNGKHKEFLSKRNIVSRDYKIKNNIFNIKFDPGYKNKTVVRSINDSNLSEVTIIATLNVNVFLKVRNPRTF